MSLPRAHMPFARAALCDKRHPGMPSLKIVRNFPRIGRYHRRALEADSFMGGSSAVSYRLSKREFERRFNELSKKAGEDREAEIKAISKAMGVEMSFIRPARWV